LLREKASSFLLDDFYRTPGGIQFEGPGSDAKPITLTIENQDYMGDIEILKEYLGKVGTKNPFICFRVVSDRKKRFPFKKQVLTLTCPTMMRCHVRTMVKPGCSREILKAAISSMVSVTDVLTVMSHPLNTELPLYHFK